VEENVVDSDFIVNSNCLPTFHTFVCYTHFDVYIPPSQCVLLCWSCLVLIVTFRCLILDALICFLSFIFSIPFIIIQFL
jgi:hypothetical protein